MIEKSIKYKIGKHAGNMKWVAKTENLKQVNQKKKN